MDENPPPTDDPVASAVAAYRASINRVGEAAEAPGTDLVPASGTDQAAAMKVRMVEQRASILRAQQEADAARSQLKKAIDDQKSALEQQMRALQAKLEPVLKRARRLGDGIDALNIYLGRDEEIDILREGERAPADMPVSVRQLVLAMDEESLIAADGDGMDFTDIGKFCEWLLASPSHLDQVLPEIKGVVALIPRRATKSYGNPWEDQAKNEANQHTYWLIHNGECLWLTTTEFVVGRFTVPPPREFTDLFIVKGRFGEPDRHLEPGSAGWAKAEEVADARTRHYMKVALLLEGLIDRTTVFHPHNGASFLSQADYDAERIRIILDGENALGTGRTPFRDWQRQKMAEVSEGMRVVGAFATRMRTYSGRDEPADVRPQGATPENFTAYVVKNSSRSYYDLQFTFDRADEIWTPNDGYRRAQTKATGYIHRSDEWVIPIDLVTVAEMHAYLNARTERHAYLNMVPTLRAAVAVKEAEEAEERPFLTALVGRLQAAGHDDAESLAADLIAWYKTGNKWHRPLASDDAKAAKLILAEARRRGAGADDAVVAQLRATYPHALVIARRTSDMIVVEAQARRYENAAQNVFATVHVHGLRGGHNETRQWQTIRRSQAAKWTILHAAAGWGEWELDPAARAHLTDDQLTEVVTRIREEHWTTMIIRYEPAKPKSIYIGPRFLAYIADGTGTGKNVSAHLEWDAAAPTVKFGCMREGDHHRDEPHWDTNWSGAPDPATTTVFENPELVSAERAAWKAARDAAEQQRAISDTVRYRLQEIRTAWERAAEERAFARFLEDFGDESLWEGHKKTVKLPRYPYDDGPGNWHREPTALHDLVEVLVDRGMDFAGSTVAAAAERIGMELDRIPADLHELSWPAPEKQTSSV